MYEPNRPWIERAYPHTRNPSCEKSSQQTPSRALPTTTHRVGKVTPVIHRSKQVTLTSLALRAPSIPPPTDLRSLLHPSVSLTRI